MIENSEEQIQSEVATIILPEFLKESPSLTPIVQINLSLSQHNEIPDEPAHELFIKEIKPETNPENPENPTNSEKNGKIELNENDIEIEIENSQDFPNRNLLNSKKKSSKQNLRTYHDLVSVIRNKSSCEWQESRYTLPST